MNKRYNEEALDLAIKHAGQSMLKETGWEHLENEAGQHIFSKEFENKMRRLVSIEKRKLRARKALKIAVRVAAAIVVVLIVSTAVIFSSEALRVQFLSMFYQKNERSIDIDFSETGKHGEPLEIIEPEYIPEGYTLQKLDIMPGNMGGISIYSNKSGNEFQVMQDNGTPSITIDNEGAKTYEKYIDGIKILVIENNVKKFNHVLFNKGTATFSIFGKIDVSELIKMAESLIKQK